MERKNLFRISGMLIFLAICLPSKAAGFFLLEEQLGGRIDIHGFAWTQFAMAVDPSLEEDKLFSGGYEFGDLAWQRNTLQLEVDFRMLDRLGPMTDIGIFVIPRFIYQGMNDMDRGIPHPGDFGRSRSQVKTFAGDEFFQEKDLREAYLYFDAKKVLGGDWNIKIGRQMVIWGESDGFRLADVINPLDLSWHYFLESFEDLREPTWMWRSIYRPDWLYETDLEIVYIPVNFEPTDFAPVYSFTEPIGRTFPQAFWGFGFDKTVVTKNKRPRSTFRNSEVGLRMTRRQTRGPLAGLEWSAYWFYTREDFPIFRLRSDGTSSFEYPREHKNGMTFNWFFEDLPLWHEANIVLRGEAVATWSFPFTSTATGTIIKRTQLNWVLGFDRPTYVPYWLDPGQLLGISPVGRTTFISGQWFQNWVPDQDQKHFRNVSNFPSIFTLFLQQRWLVGEEITPQIFFAWEQEERHGLFQPMINYRWGDYWNFSIQYDLFFGSTDARGFFGTTRNKDDVIVKVSFSF